MSDSDQNPEITISTRFETDTSGADQATDRVDQMAKSVEGAGEKADGARKGIERMVEEAGTVRESQRVAMGFFDTFEGGGRAVEGAAELMRFFLSTVVELDPPLATLLILIASVTAVFMKHGAEAKKASTDTKEAVDSEKEAIASLEKQAEGSYPRMLQMLQAQTTEILKQVAAQKDLQRAQDELENAEVAGRIADLDAEEEKDLAGKSEGEQAVIKREYEKKRIELRHQDQVDKAQQELSDKRQAQKDAQNAVQEKENEAQAAQQMLTQAYSVVEGDADTKLAKAGVKSDAQVAGDRLAELGNLAQQNDATGSYRGLTSEETIEQENLQRSVPELQQKESISGKSFDSQIETLKKQKIDAAADEKRDLAPSILDEISDPALLLNNQQMAADARTRADKATAQIQAIEEYEASMNAARKVIDEGVPKFQELNSAVPALQTKVEAATTQVQVTQQKLSNLHIEQGTEDAKLTAQQTREIAKEEFDRREAHRAVAEDNLKTELTNPRLQEPDREHIQKQIEKLTMEGAQDKLSNATAMGLSDPDIIKLVGAKSNTQRVVDYKIEAERKKEAEAAARLIQQQSKIDSREVGQEAVGEIENLGGSKQMVSEARSSVSEMNKGNQEGAVELLGVLNRFSTTVKTLTQGQASLLGKIMDRLQEVERELGDHNSKITSLRVGMNS